MKKAKIEEKIYKLLDENKKVGDRNTIIQLSLIAVFTGSILFLSFFISTNAQVDLSIAILTIISVIVSSIALIFACCLDKTNEKEEKLQYAQYINEQWVHNNMIDNEFYKTIRPNEKNIAKESMLFLYDNFGIEFLMR